MAVATSQTPTAGAPGSDMPADEMLRRIIDELLAGRTLGSLQGIDKGHVEGLYAVAHSLYQRERYDDARRIFMYLMVLDHYDTRFMLGLASCLQMLQQYDKAIEYFSMASLFRLDDPRPTFHTAECLLAQGRIDEAHEALSIVALECEEPRHQVLKQRARAMLDLLGMKAGQPTQRMPS